MELRSIGIGTALISLGLLPDGVAPASNGQTVVNVVEPDLSLPDFTLGYQLQLPVRLKLSENLSTVTYDQTFAAASGDQYQAAVIGGCGHARRRPGGGHDSSWAAPVAAVLCPGPRTDGTVRLQLCYRGETYRSTLTLDRPS